VRYGPVYVPLEQAVEGHAGGAYAVKAMLSASANQAATELVSKKLGTRHLLDRSKG